MATQLGRRIVEAEINPIFVLPAGEGVRAADGVAVPASGAHAGVRCITVRLSLLAPERGRKEL
jgi:hypothetical protein